jgi:nicotinate-nucleotide pyrophosphorylase (carboxylating)
MLEKSIAEIIKLALKEDDVFRDITSDLTIDEKAEIAFQIAPRQDIIFCGEDIIFEVFAQLKKAKKFKNSNLDLEFFANDGDKIKAKKPILTGRGSSKIILAGERVILNLIQHLSAISTATNEFVQKLNDKNIKILDTRKTLPGLRALQKYAVKIGGGKNHRFSLSEMILIKDNHIAACGSVKKAILNARQGKKKIEIECDNFAQVKEAVKSAPDIIMLDNMSIAEIKKCTREIRKNSKILIEVSGGINLENIANYRDLDIDFISIGSLTHSVKAVDIGLDIVN